MSHDGYAFAVDLGGVGANSYWKVPAAAFSSVSRLAFYSAVIDIFIVDSCSPKGVQY